MAIELAGWHDLYVTVGAAAATLVGLLFVGLSLHIRVVVAHPEVRSLARVTLTDFFVVLPDRDLRSPANRQLRAGGLLARSDRDRESRVDGSAPQRGPGARRSPGSRSGDGH